MTTEGGGAVAFPVMTLALNVEPTVARDFSLMIQSCGDRRVSDSNFLLPNSGLSAASFTIFFMGIVVEWHSLVFTSFGGLFGLITGLELIDPLLTPPQKKMAFVSVFFSFAMALFLLNSEKKRVTFNRIENFRLWKAIFLVFNGFIGGQSSIVPFFLTTVFHFRDFFERGRIRHRRLLVLDSHSAISGQREGGYSDFGYPHGDQ
jgi:hypothetical protein